MSDPITVSNSSCLIVLEAIGQLDLLPQLFGTVTIPAAVAARSIHDAGTACKNGLMTLTPA